MYMYMYIYVYIYNIDINTHTVHMSHTYIHWLVVWNIFFSIQLGISSSQLGYSSTTNQYMLHIENS